MSKPVPSPVTAYDEELRPLPRLALKPKIGEIAGFTCGDVFPIDCNPHPPIKAPSPPEFLTGKQDQGDWSEADFRQELHEAHEGKTLALSFRLHVVHVPRVDSKR